MIGRGATFAVAAEAALKLKETSAIHAEAFSSAEVLHGPAGVIGAGFPGPLLRARRRRARRLLRDGRSPRIVRRRAAHRRRRVRTRAGRRCRAGRRPCADHPDRRAARLLSPGRGDRAPPRPRSRPAAAPDEGDADGLNGARIAVSRYLTKVREWIAIRSEKFAASTARSPRPSAPAPRAICGAVALWARRDRHRGRGDQGAAGDTRPRLRLYESACCGRRQRL